ncbi:MAG: hypothetical protein IRZ08_13060 [Frankia sp.]|nr:hypothetical protein [Frankia sp.]
MTEQPVQPAEPARPPQAAAAPGAPRPPADEDLSTILTGLMTTARRKTVESRRVLANDDLTREYLEAGLRLIEAQLVGAEGASLEEPPLLRWLSQRAVINEVGRAGRLRGSEGTFRDRWPYQPDYIRDVLAYSLRQAQWAGFLDLTAGPRSALADHPDPVQAVHEAAYTHITVTRRTSAIRSQLIGAAMAERDELVRATLQEMYQVAGDAWLASYAEAIAARGMTLRPGLTLEDVNTILTAVTEGMQLRLMVDPDDGLIDHERRTSLLGTAALALIAACFDHFGDGLSLEEAVRLGIGSTATSAADAARAVNGDSGDAGTPGGDGGAGAGDGAPADEGALADDGALAGAGTPAQPGADERSPRSANA